MIGKSKNKIAIIGPYPPPYGGISVHIQRILSNLPKESFVFFNVSRSSKGVGKKFYGINKYFYLLSFVFIGYKLIHYHSTSTKVRVGLSLISLIKPNIYLHLHGESYLDSINSKGIASFILRKTLPHINILASNSFIAEKLSKYNPKSLTEIDAFLPPSFKSDEYKKIIRLIPAFPTKYKISMVGWFHSYKGADLYGFDISLECLKILRDEKKIDVSIVASVNGIRDNNLYNRFIAKRKELNLENYFILMEDELQELYPLFLNSQIFIRPTNTDGNSVSIKESIWFGCNAIASDVIVRPNGVTTFSNRDPDDLANKILFQILENNFLTLDDRLNNIQNRKFIHPLISKVYGME